MMWGAGALAWGLMVRYLGIGLGLAIGCGSEPPPGRLFADATGHAADLVKDAAALRCSAVCSALAGIVF